jgi:molybdopterin-guanine dinucleotide biosynthesis protein A
MGQPKAWLSFGPERLLQRVVRLVAEVAEPIVVVAAPGQDCPPLPSTVRVVRDPVSGRGPLQGLAAGLAALPQGTETAFVTATDAPFVQPAVIALLRELVEEDDLALPFVAGFHHPLAAVYRPSAILPAVESLLARNQLRLLGLVEAVRTRLVTEEEFRRVDPGLRSLRNLNTLADYHQALADAGLFPTS